MAKSTNRKTSRKIKKESFLHADETPVQVLKEGEKDNTKKSTMWIFTTGKKSKTPIRLYLYDQSKSGQVAKKYLEGFKGSLQTDAYSSYKKLDNKSIACWAHLRRYFKDALPRSNLEGDIRAKKAIKEINKLFKLEENWYKLRDEKLLDLREKEERPLVEDFFEWVKTEIYKTAPKSKLGKAFAYALNHEEKLKNYLKEPTSKSKQ